MYLLLDRSLARAWGDTCVHEEQTGVHTCNSCGWDQEHKRMADSAAVQNACIGLNCLGVRPSLLMCRMHPHPCNPKALQLAVHRNSP